MSPGTSPVPLIIRVFGDAVVPSAPNHQGLRGRPPAIQGAFYAAPAWEAMNPIAIAGVLAVTMASAGLMVSFTGEQVRYSQAAGQTAALQAERLQEGLSVTAAGGALVVENTGPLPVQIREIRVVDGSGRVIATQGSGEAVGVSQTAEPRLDPGIRDALERILRQR